MAIQVNELIGTRAMARSALGAPTAVRTFLVFDDEPSLTSPVQLTAKMALAEADVPKIGEVHPEDRKMTVISQDVTASVETDYAQKIVCNYAVTGLDGGGSFTAMSTSVRSVIAQTWRVGAIGPSDYSFVGVTNDDIQGTKIDFAGKPFSIPIFQQTLDIRSPFANEPNFNAIRHLTNKRNASPFYRFPAGTLVYLGANASVSSGNVWTTTHKFAADENYHYRQMAKPNEDRNPELEKTDLVPKLLQAKKVVWAQAFALGNFGALNLGTSL
jgi:hypothetical protein